MNVEKPVNHTSKQVMSYLGIRIYSKGSSVFVPDTRNSSLYLLLGGTAEVYQYTLDGMFISLYRYGKNSCSGKVEPYYENRTTLGASAIDTCRIVKFPRKSMETWIREDNGFCEFLLCQMALKTAENLDACIRSSPMELEDRVLYCLYRRNQMGTLSDLTKERPMNEVCIPIYGLNRVLAQYREEGLVAYDRHRFRTVDEEGFLDVVDKLVGN